MNKKRSQKRSKPQRSNGHHAAPPALPKGEFFYDDLVDLMKEWGRNDCGSHAVAAEVVGVSVSYWYAALSGRCKPGPKILRGLGIIRQYQYNRSNGR